MRLRSVFLWSMVGALGLAAGLGIAALLLPRFAAQEHLLGSVLIFAIFSLDALMLSAVLEKRRLVPLMGAGLVSCAGAFITWMVLAWWDYSAWGWHGAETVARFGGTFTVPAAVAAHWGLVSLARFGAPWPRLVQRATLGVTALLGAFILVLVWWGEAMMRARLLGDDDIWRILGVLGILSACGTVVTPILYKMQSLRGGPSGESVPLRLRLRLVCPRCAASIELPGGPAKCTACGLHIAIQVEEPRCACGYLLHRLEGDRCPECGRAIPESDRWAARAA